MRALECKYGLTDPNTSDSGTKERLTVMEGSYWPTETPTKVNGSRIRLMARDSTCMQMGLDMKDSGARINKRDLDVRHGLMEASIKGCIMTVKSMAEENSHGRTVHLTQVTGT